MIYGSPINSSSNFTVTGQCSRSKFPAVHNITTYQIVRDPALDTVTTVSWSWDKYPIQVEDSNDDEIIVTNTVSKVAPFQTTATINALDLKETVSLRIMPRDDVPEVSTDYTRVIHILGKYCMTLFMKNLTTSIPSS